MNEFNAAHAIAVAAVVYGFVKILTGPIARAIGDRIRGVRGTMPDPRLAEELDQVQTRLAEVEERLDFAERLLASKEQAQHLPGGAHR